MGLGSPLKGWVWGWTSGKEKNTHIHANRNRTLCNICHPAPLTSLPPLLSAPQHRRRPDGRGCHPAVPRSPHLLRLGRSSPVGVLEQGGGSAGQQRRRLPRPAPRYSPGERSPAGDRAPWPPCRCLPSACSFAGALEIRQALPAHGGRYTCTARSAAGTARKHLRLTVQGSHGSGVLLTGGSAPSARG